MVPRLITKNSGQRNLPDNIQKKRVTGYPQFILDRTQCNHPISLPRSKARTTAVFPFSSPMASFLCFNHPSSGIIRSGSTIFGFEMGVVRFCFTSAHRAPLSLDPIPLLSLNALGCIPQVTSQVIFSSFGRPVQRCLVEESVR